MVLATASPAEAYTGQEPAGNAKVTIAQAWAIALKAHPGQITDEELEREAGGAGLGHLVDFRLYGAPWAVLNEEIMKIPDRLLRVTAGVGVVAILLFGTITASAHTEIAVAPEQTLPGDIPNTQVFINYILALKSTKTERIAFRIMPLQRRNAQKQDVHQNGATPTPA